MGKHVYRCLTEGSHQLITFVGLVRVMTRYHKPSTKIHGTSRQVKFGYNWSVPSPRIPLTTEDDMTFYEINFMTFTTPLFVVDVSHSTWNLKKSLEGVVVAYCSLRLWWYPFKCSSNVWCRKILTWPMIGQWLNGLLFWDYMTFIHLSRENFLRSNGFFFQGPLAKWEYLP